jgi:hypothetical protein
MFAKSVRAAVGMLVALLPVSVFAQEWATKMFSTTSHDFGVVARGEKAEYAFALENLYVEDVHVAAVRASCSCTRPEIKTPTLKTYDKGVILATYNTSAFQGARGATLTVTFDRPYFAEVQLQVRGYVRGDVELNPGIVDFGNVEEGNHREKAILVNYAGGDDWRIVSAHCANPHLSATASEMSRGNGQVTYRVLVRLDPQAPSGGIADQIVLDTNDREGRPVTIRVTGTVESAISLSPGLLLMGSVQPGQKVTKQLVVRGRQPFQVREVTCDGPGFTVTAKDGAAQKKFHLISVTFEADSRLSKSEGTIRVDTTIGTPSRASAYAAVAHQDVTDQR